MEGKAWRDKIIRNNENFNQQLLTQLSDTIDKVELKIAQIESSWRIAGGKIIDKEALSLRNHEAGYNRVFNGFFTDIGLIHIPPSKTLGMYKDMRDNLWKDRDGDTPYYHGSCDAIRDIEKLLKGIEANESMDLYNAEYTGDMCLYAKKGDIITVKNLDYKGDWITSKVTIIDFRYDAFTQGCCGLFPKLALAKCDDGKYYNVGSCPEIDCKTCIQINKEVK